MIEQNISTSDLFHQSWNSFSWQKRTRIMRTVQYIQRMKPGQFYRGYLINRVLKKLCLKKALLKKLSPEQRVDCFYDIDLINNPWYDFPIKELSIGKTKLQPPEAKLLNFTYNRWKVTDAKFTKYLCLSYDLLKDQTESEEIKIELGKFLACIYTPKAGWHEDQLADQGLKLIRKLAIWEQELIIETFAHIRNHVISRFPDLFLTPTDPTEDFDDRTPTYTGQMWHDMHYDIAETEPFKGYENAGESNMYHVLYYLNKLVIRNKKLKEDANAN